MYVLDAKKHGQEARLLEAAPEPPEAGSSLLTDRRPACSRRRPNSRRLVHPYVLMLIWTPSRHFVHLLSPVGMEARDLVQYPYHISVCYLQDIWREYAWKRHQMYRLQNLYSTDVEMVIPISSFGSGGSAVITEGCDLYKNLHPLWSTGGEGYKSGLHISS